MVLAYCGRFDEAELEMGRIAPFVGNASADMQIQIARQCDLIKELRVNGVPPQRRLPHGMLIKNSVAASNPVRKYGKVGRNEPCPCGSGQKFKKCHGSN